MRIAKLETLTEHRFCTCKICVRMLKRKSKPSMLQVEILPDLIKLTIYYHNPTLNYKFSKILANSKFIYSSIAPVKKDTSHCENDEFVHR